MKNLSLSLIITLVFSTALISCQNTTYKEVTQDVVDDLDDVMQNAEDEVKNIINSDSLNSLEKKYRQENAIQENTL